MTYLLNNLPTVGHLFLEHLRMALIALIIAFALALPLGVLAARLPRVRRVLLGTLSIIYTIPSLSLLILLIPLTGLSQTTAIIVLVVYALLVLVRNIVVGLTTIDPSIIDAADGMGMSAWQRFRRVEFPLALPLILAGARVAAVTIIGIGTVAAYISAGGLGVLLFEGVRTSNPQKIIAGAVAVAVLAFCFSGVLRFLEKRATATIYGDGRA